MVTTRNAIDQIAISPILQVAYTHAFWPSLASDTEYPERIPR